MSESKLLITHLHLEGIKSYEEADVALPSGTIAICGANGAGKSTLIEAIGLALFGSQRVRQEQLIREGSAHGRIDISFISGTDGLSYTVTRELRRTGISAARLHSDAHGFIVATGVGDVQSEVAQHLGIRDELSPDTLFDGVIGVPQGQLTGDFLLTPTPRRTRFEELLSLKEFNTVYQRLSGPLAHGRDRLSYARGRLTALGEQVQADQGVRPELVALQSRLGKAQREATELEQAHAEAGKLLEQMDRAEATLQATRERLARCDLAVQLAAQRVEESERRRQEAVDAAERAEKTRPGHDRYLALEVGTRDLERSRQERDSLQRRLGEVDTELARLESAAVTLADRLSTASRSRTEAERLRPYAERQSALEEALSEAEKHLALRTELASQSERYRRQVAELDERLPELAATAESASSAEEAVQKASDRLEAIRAEGSEVSAKLATVTAEIESRQQAEEAVRKGETTVCPVCRRPFVEGDVEGFLQHLRDEIDEHRRLGEALQEKRGQLRRLFTEQQRLLKKAQQALQKARDGAAALQAVQNQHAQAVAEEEAATARLAELAGAEVAAASLRSDLDALGDPRARLRSAETLAAQHDELEAELAIARGRMEKAANDREALQTELGRFADLDRRLEETVAARDALRDDFDTHRRFAPLAAELADRQAEMEARRSTAAESRTELTTVADEVAQAEQAYDADRHAALRRREHELAVDVARLQAEVEDSETRLGEAAARLNALEKLEDEQRHLIRSSERDQRAVDLLSFLRDTIRRTGPEIARRVLARVSQAATITYSELMADHAGVLVWGDDYGVTVERAGRIRQFVQLSGGEQVAAALSVRLALLREVSDLRIAFLDEPTINLDEDRRRSLAEQMRSIRDLDQLFVISHDDSLESVTDNVIRVRKENGLSLLESA